MSTASPPSSEFDWLYDYISAFLKSPPWTVPLNTFIDENCIIFDAEEENKLSYTDCHNKFMKLIEDLLERSLKEIGVPEDQFLLACSKGVSTEVNKLIFGQILAVEDFLTFKKMMVKRNMELEVEAMRALQKVDFSKARAATPAAAAAAPTAPPSATTAELLPKDRSEADSQLELALRLSAELAKTEAATTAAGAGAGAAAIAAAIAESAAAPPPAEHKRRATEKEFEVAVQASVVDHDIYLTEFKREQAELEHAIALSIALEAERLRLLELEEKQARDALLASSRDAAALVAAAADAAAAAAAAAAATAAAAAAASAAAAAAAETKAPAPVTATVVAPSAGAGSAPPAEPTPSTPSAASAGSPLPPRRLLADLPALGNPNRTIATAALAETRRAADDVFRLNQETMQKQAASRSTVLAAAKVDEAELARRQALMRAQRQLLVEKKNKEREELLSKFNAEKKGGAPAGSAGEAKADEEEKKKLSIREALAARIKVDMIASERRRIAEAEAGKSAALHDQLRRSERLREEKIRKQAEDEAALAAQERDRKAKLAALHAVRAAT